MEDLYFITSNENKLREFQEILEVELKREDFDLAEIQSIDVEQVAKAKALSAYSRLGKPVFIEDTGLYFEGLNGIPGAMIKLFLERLSLNQICSLLDDNRRAVAKTCLSYCPDGKEVFSFIGEVRGVIAEEPMGGQGFGWDALFIPEGSNKTFAEMSKEEKNMVSMRKLACIKFKNYLINNRYEKKD